MAPGKLCLGAPRLRVCQWQQRMAQLLPNLVPGRDFVRLWVSGWKSAREVSEETLMGGFGGWVSPPANED
ncbi:hypothetical protein Pcinc_013944 [Petrolisthes cinctipes]|uniref:Uncharacterized protein n=1 Tax=Petrolisthes cinctipes TaxID=88211 RepID=A0AAE1FW07_PETCI|nr:hypothetical protein Pcinc_035180 [Petrolisthes cinctipes]KAK3881624.1 hypothetical protein Pcinc_013944 [Petrolisthes cinctipes]